MLNTLDAQLIKLSILILLLMNVHQFNIINQNNFLNLLTKNSINSQNSTLRRYFDHFMCSTTLIDNYIKTIINHIDIYIYIYLKHNYVKSTKNHKTTSLLYHKG